MAQRDERGRFLPGGASANPTGDRRDGTPSRRAYKHGLYVPRTRACDGCQREYTARKPGSTYCSDACRKRFGRYGRSYGTVVPRQFGWTKH
jgi:hypothetical protein